MSFGWHKGLLGRERHCNRKPAAVCHSAQTKEATSSAAGEEIHSGILKFSERATRAEFTQWGWGVHQEARYTAVGQGRTQLLSKASGWRQKDMEMFGTFLANVWVRESTAPKCHVSTGALPAPWREMRGSHGSSRRPRTCRSGSGAQRRHQKGLSGSYAISFSTFNSAELSLTSKSSSFPASRALLAWGCGTVSFTEVTTESQGG